MKIASVIYAYGLSHGARMMNKSKDDKSIEMLPIAFDDRSRALLDIARRAANTNATILISGETGVGKEMIARYIHMHSPYKNGPYISINCAALPEHMIESILFGYEKGAFTGSVTAYAGKFEQANDGTLLLDEIAELPFELQAKLLRVLQEREVERLGGKHSIQINVRIIAATNRDLIEQVKLGLFRNDLYYRLNVVPITCEPLRKRPLDILPLANFFIEKYSKMLNIEAPAMTKEAENKLINHTWPGNIRELENVVHRTLIMLTKNTIDLHDIVLNESFENETNNCQFNSKLKEGEAKIILDVLADADGSRDIAAKKLNISPRTLRYKLSKLKSIGIKIP